MGEERCGTGGAVRVVRCGWCAAAWSGKAWSGMSFGYSRGLSTGWRAGMVRCGVPIRSVV